MSQHALTRTIAAASLLLLAACGGTDHAEADVRFAQQMVPHHAQAVEMADQALDTSRDADVRRLAEEIRAAQDPEIETMTGWLEEWGEDVPDTSGGMAGMGDMSEMDGMMTDAEMQRLDTTTGAEFDRLWLRLMVEHHQGAIEMARAEQADGTYDAAVDLAKDVERTQQAEIAEMEELLGQG
ncbi:DUF305 domain-containing protein [Nocardioides aurantiacus]|uniref:Uncharacterized protein (DUF305 family) n=1 Tax=Nocardioides aurantiacus TaxID=86796 RepID=A0A3N2CZ33_9ACTN|nr:DUF305 domain-containing protein [Nocardioides aurantiacus]ROR92790.1 uncharacterized protein (DUF305 family) [Nocardioides aurantiacus]